MPSVLAKITIRHLECDADDYTTEDGQGFPDSIEPWDDDVIEIDGDDLTDSGRGLDDHIQTILDDHSVGQWDGGRTAYDPDGTRMSPSGLVTETFALIERF